MEQNLREPGKGKVITMIKNSAKDVESAGRLGSERTKRRDNLDPLTKDVLAAEMAGMSYGKYKALHPHSGKPAGDLKFDNGKFAFTCINCGTVVITKGRKKRKFCCEKCRDNHYRKLKQERKKAR